MLKQAIEKSNNIYEGYKQGVFTRTGYSGGGRVIGGAGRRRSTLARLLAIQGNRDYLEDFNLNPPDTWQLQSVYEFGGIAKRAVEVFPDAIWSSDVKITDNPEDMDEDNPTPFETAIKELVRKHKLWNVLTRAHYTIGYSTYCALHIGILDGKEKDEPFRPTLKGIDGLGYLAIHDDINAGMSQFETDISKANYGDPTFYNLRSGGVDTGSSPANGISNDVPPTETFQCDASRIVHIPAQMGQNELIGKPVLQSVYYDLISMFKVLHASAEEYVMRARNPLVLGIDKEAGTTEEQLEQIDEQFADMVDNGWTRTIVVQGGKLETISTTPSDPTGTIEQLKMSIAGTLAVPKRILEGSEMGNLASSQDQSNFASAVEHHRKEFCEPVILRPLLDRLIEMRILPEPNEGEYEIVWPSLVNDSSVDKAKTLNQIGSALRGFGFTKPILTRRQVVEEILGMTYEEEALEDEFEEERQLADEEQQKSADMQVDLANRMPDKTPPANKGNKPPANAKPKQSKNAGEQTGDEGETE